MKSVLSHTNPLLYHHGGEPYCTGQIIIIILLLLLLLLLIIIIIIIIIAVISIASYLTYKCEHTELYKINNAVYITNLKNN